MLLSAAWAGLFALAAWVVLGGFARRRRPDDAFSPRRWLVLPDDPRGCLPTSEDVGEGPPALVPRAVPPALAAAPACQALAGIFLNGQDTYSWSRRIAPTSVLAATSVAAAAAISLDFSPLNLGVPDIPPPDVEHRADQMFHRPIFHDLGPNAALPPAWLAFDEALRFAPATQSHEAFGERPALNLFALFDSAPSLASDDMVLPAYLSGHSDWAFAG